MPSYENSNDEPDYFFFLPFLAGAFFFALLLDAFFLAAMFFLLVKFG